MSIEVLNANTGLSSVLPTANEVPHLPNSDTYVVGLVESKSLDNLFLHKEQDKLLEKSLTPKLSRPEQLEPSSINLLLNEDLKPMLENKELLKAYMDMMIGG